jgi:hypothetical protein
MNMKTIYISAFALVAAGLVIGCAGDGESFDVAAPTTTGGTAGSTAGGNTGGATGGATGGTASTRIGVWMTTSVANSDNTFQQKDRLARPVVNEVLATVANDRHRINDEIPPTQDRAELERDIESFLTVPANRSRATKDVIKSILVPDVMMADLSKTGAAYLGVETGGKSGGEFGGRKLTDDVVDVSLRIVFGNLVSALGLAPDDGKSIPSLTTDNVGPEGKRFTNTFPYVGAPR